MLVLFSSLDSYNYNLAISYHIELMLTRNHDSSKKHGRDLMR
jgi:hypothetical protein